MQKYVLVCLLENRAAGDIFSATTWPLHITLAANFAVDWTSTNLQSRLAALLARHQPITVTAGEDALFGPQQQTRVTLLNMNEQLVQLHCDVIALLKRCNAVFDEPQYLEAGYRAHATVQEHNRLRQGDVVHLRDVTVVDMFPDNDITKRKLLQTLPIGQQH